MKLAEIIAADAAYMDKVEVVIDRSLPTVTIKAPDDEVEDDDIFLQGEDAEQFVTEFDDLARNPELSEVYFSDMWLHLAKPYAEAFWH